MRNRQSYIYSNLSRVYIYIYNHRYESTKGIKQLLESITERFVVGVTEYNSKENIQKYYDSGMDLVLPKPVSRNALTKVFKTLNSFD